jgi:GMP synthase (glutamine-hydrolysing)
VTEQTDTSPDQASATEQRPVLVVDFGAQYAQLIARRVREAGVYSEIVPHTASADDIAAKNPVGIILSGGPSSVYEEGAPQLDSGVFDLNVPTLGICYGFQVMAQALGGEVAHSGLREYGATDASIIHEEDILFDGQPVEQNVWMSHGDQVSKAPAGFEVLARTGATPVAAFGSAERRMYGVQWHPEVKHSDHGQRIIENFLHKAAGLPAD